MDAGQQQELARPEDPPLRTLGDVLYARPKGLVAEKEWADLVRAVAAGDQAALHALYERTHRPVFTLAMRITGRRETAEELTVDVFHDVWRRASRYDAETGTVLAWIMNQARSRAIDRLRFEQRKKRRDANFADEGDGADTDDGLGLLELKERRLGLRAALTVLSAPEREAIEAAYFQGETYAEVAARLGEPLGTVKTRIRSGLHKLRRALSPEERKP